MAFAGINGYWMHYEAFGNGSAPALILIHGGQGGSDGCQVLELCPVKRAAGVVDRALTFSTQAAQLGLQFPHSGFRGFGPGGL